SSRAGSAVGRRPRGAAGRPGPWRARRPSRRPARSPPYRARARRARCRAPSPACSPCCPARRAGCVERRVRLSSEGSGPCGPFGLWIVRRNYREDPGRNETEITFPARRARSGSRQTGEVPPSMVRMSEGVAHARGTGRRGGGKADELQRLRRALDECQRRLQRDQRLLALNRTISRILAEACEVEDALIAAIRAICRSEGWDAGQYWRYDERSGLLRYQTGWSLSTAEIKAVADESKEATFAPGTGLVGLVWQTAEPLWVADLAAETRVQRKDIAARTGWKNAFLFPVLSQRKAIGVLDFSARCIPEPDEHLLQVIHGLAMQIGHYYAQAETMRQLRESEERYASTVKLAAIGISHIGVDGRFVHVNRQLCEMLGYTREELLELSFRDVSHPEDRHVTDKDRARLYAGEIDSLQAEKRYLRKDGTPVWVRINAALKRHPDG